MPFDFQPASIPDVILVKPRLYADARGFFLESYHERSFHEAGIDTHFRQDNHSCSSQNVLRGLHYQLKYPQAKLLRVVRGMIFDVAVDIRRGSPTFGQWTGALLSAENHHQLFIPRGFAHGFEVLSPSAEVLYKADYFYTPEDELGIHWNDPVLAISWSTRDPILSPKDMRLPNLATVPDALLPDYR